MREHGLHQPLFRGLEIHRHHIDLHQLDNLGADHVRTKELPGLAVEDRLDQALFLAERNCLVVGDERKTADTDVLLPRMRRRVASP